MKLRRNGPRTFRAEIDPLALVLVDQLTIDGRRRWCVVVETYTPVPGNYDLAETTPAGRAIGPEFRSIADLQAWARDPDADVWTAERIEALRSAGKGPRPT